jgi:hypothetical protein
LILSIPEIEKVVKDLDEESKALKKEIFKLAWFMRGSINIDQAYQLDYQDRILIGEIVQENLEFTKDSGLPFF